MANDNMNENKASSIPEGIQSIADDEALKEIDFGNFLEENAKGSPLFEGFHDDIAKTEKSLESELQSLYDDIMGSGPATIVPKPMSLLTAEDAEPAKITLSDPEILPENEEHTLDELWIDPEEYMDIPVVSLDEDVKEEEPVLEGEIPAETFFNPSADEEAPSLTDIAKDDIFSLIDSLKSEADGNTGFEDILSEIESNPEILPIDEDNADKLIFEEPESPDNGDEVLDELVANEVDSEENEAVADTSDEDFDRELAILLGDLPEEQPEPEKTAEEPFVIEIPEEEDFDYTEDAAPSYELQPDYSSVIAAVSEKPEAIDITAHDDDDEYEKLLDEPSDENAEKKKGVGEVIRKIVLTLSIITIVVSLGVLVNTYLIEPYRAKTATQNLAEQMSQNSNAHSNKVVDSANSDTESKYPQGMLAKYAQLYDSNSDLSGWISIPALQIELPIAKGTDNNYYRNRDIFKKYTMYGVPFFDYRMTDLRNLHRNTVLYGHNMRSDDLIFGMLENYRTIEGYQSAPVIECNTIYGDYTWFVYGVFISNAYEEQDNGYVFPYNFIDISDAKFADYIKEIDKRKFYTTGVDLNVTDKILTLSTCCYDFTDARLVVVARLRRPGESISVDTSNAYYNQNPKYPQAWYNANKKQNPYAEDARW